MSKLTRKEAGWRKRFEAFISCTQLRNLYRTQPGLVPQDKVEHYWQDASETPDCYEIEALYAYYLYLLDKEQC